MKNMAVLILMILTWTKVYAQDFSWGWVNVYPKDSINKNDEIAAAINKVDTMVKAILEINKLPEGYKIGIIFDTEKAIKKLHINVNRPYTGKVAVIFSDQKDNSFDAVVWADYRVSEDDVDYGYVSKYIKATLGLIPEKK